MAVGSFVLAYQIRLPFHTLSSSLPLPRPLPPKASSSLPFHPASAAAAPRTLPRRPPLPAYPPPSPAVDWPVSVAVISVIMAVEVSLSSPPFPPLPPPLLLPKVSLPPSSFGVVSGVLKRRGGGVDAPPPRPPPPPLPPSPSLASLGECTEGIIVSERLFPLSPHGPSSSPQAQDYPRPFPP
ncbi:hypothetical protein E2C01_100377 [Portunus trituberculatus]|uniref:Uncharacterized protein n=1 Tax=Portunus trituberculatus TaxID=210409 RepID=A0A5B7KCX4_PORTR|nr:hypothetical protein [Portunus trituberculatus]